MTIIVLTFCLLPSATSVALRRLIPLTLFLDISSFDRLWPWFTTAGFPFLIYPPSTVWGTRLDLVILCENVIQCHVLWNPWLWYCKAPVPWVSGHAKAMPVPCFWGSYTHISTHHNRIGHRHSRSRYILSVKAHKSHTVLEVFARCIIITLKDEF